MAGVDVSFQKIPICLWSFMGKAAGRRACSEKISPRHVPMMSRAISQSCPVDAVPGMSWLCDRMVCDCNKGCVLLGGWQEQPIELICNFFHGLMSLKSLRVIFIFTGCTCRLRHAPKNMFWEALQKYELALNKRRRMLLWYSGRLLGSYLVQ